MSQEHWIWVAILVAVVALAAVFFLVGFVFGRAQERANQRPHEDALRRLWLEERNECLRLTAILKKLGQEPRAYIGIDGEVWPRGSNVEQFKGKKP